MTQDHSSKISFSIEESVWLNKDQEVDEILSLSLDPDITVQENGDYVQVRGGLKLTGEYRPSENGSSGEVDEKTLSDQVQFRSIEEVTINEDGTGQIRHYFPIDVTIPMYRITSLDDIYVNVDTFDYDLPEKGCIQLSADVVITGMSEPSREDATAEYDHEEEAGFEHGSYEHEEEAVEEHRSYSYDEEAEDEDRSFEYEAYKVPSEERVVSFPTEQNSYEANYNSSYTESEQEERYEEAQYETETQERYYDDPEQVEAIAERIVEEQKQEQQTPSIAFGVVKTEAQSYKDETEQEEQPEQQSYGKLKNLASNSRDEVQVTEVQLTEEAEMEEKKYEPKEENALYLTKMLSKGEEEFSRLKMCIVQDGETIDMIAARYEVSSSVLIRVNNLNEDAIEQGQILYIPRGVTN